MKEHNIKKIIIISGLLTIILLLFLFSIKLINDKETKTEGTSIVDNSNIKQNETQIPKWEPGVYRLGPFRFENDEFIRKEGKFISWEELEKQGIMIVKDGELSTPWPEGDYGPDNTLAQENIDGIVILPEKITSIEERTFSRCNITEIVLPDNLKDIKRYTFLGCHELVRITIPNSVKNIGASAFDSCDKLKEITFNTGLKKIENNAFIHCSNLINVTLPSSLLEIEDNVFKNCEKLSKIQIPDSVKKIGSAAFRGCKITDLKVPDTVDKIGASAFWGVSHIEYKGSATYGNNDKFWGANTMNGKQ